ncbi:MAG: 3-hydroxyacyl-CoA dehydrogenase NAD-binding domain-containing protein [Syntrophales bacterium]|nr:3-hydroxyacyl-CoA dehydrogenase NAD-binding domain-containing protein [Syntrophales bacterium]
MSKISKIGVVGAGNMGSGIAQKIAQEGLDVVMVDTGDELVKRGMDNIKQLLREGVERKIFHPDDIGRIMSRITGTTDLQALADADLVIEAVFEDKGVKTELFKRLDSICMDKTILATNTSSFYVREFAEATSRPDRVIGLHYFYHPAKNRLLEVIPQEKTSAETIDRALLAAKLHGKTAILVKDTPGFAVNRFFVPFLNEAARMLEEGLAGIPTIEEAAKRAFRIGMGPFELMNVTRLPITFHSTVTLGNELGSFYATAGIMKSQMGKKATDWDLSGEVQEEKITAVMDRFYGVCLGVAAALVDEGVATMEDTDRGAKVGLRWALGPFEIMNRLGIEKTFALVEKVVEKYPGFKMPGLLTRQRQAGRPFAFTLVNLAIHEDIATITINRPEAMNALNEAVVEQLAERFSEADQNPGVSAIVFQGAGKAFVAGADIRYFVEKIKAGKIDDIVAFTRKGHQLFRRIEDSNKLTIALLDGLSMGGGSELALACQAIVATPAGSLSFPETGIGIYPGLGGMLRLGRHLGPELAKYYTFTGAAITASDAQELGMVTRLVDPSAVEEAIRNLIGEDRPDKYRPRPIPNRFTLWQTLFGAENTAILLAAKIPPGVDEAVASRILKTIGNKAPLALKLINQIIDRQAKTSRDEGIEIELDHLGAIFATADALEGLSSLGRKKPEYKGL